MPAPPEFLTYVDEKSDDFIKRLAVAVAIASVSSEPESRPKVIEMGNWLDEQLRGLGVTTRLVKLDGYMKEPQNPELPPAILGRIGNDASKKTVLVYGHYDVQPAAQVDGWSGDPFKLKEEADGRLVGRGATDDKGPIMGWLNVLQWHHEKQLPLPVNILFCFEGMEESGSQGLDALVEQEKAGWFKGTDCVCISDNYWLNTRTPALTYGLRGIVCFELTIHGPGHDLHSGIFGRTVHEPMTDLIALMGTLVGTDGKLLVPGVEEMVPPPDDAERALYAKLDYTISDVDAGAGASIALSDDRVEVFMGRMRYPSLSLHGIEGAFSGPGTKTVIPAKVIGKFSIRLVPPQTPKEVAELVTIHLQAEFSKLNTKSKMCIDVTDQGMPWVGDYKHWSYTAATRATEAIYNKTPDLMREGGSIPVTLTFADALQANVLLLPMGRGDDGAHSTNEKIDRDNFIKGTKVLGTYLYEIAAISKEQGLHKV